MSTRDIYNCRVVNDTLITCGQPSEAQLRAAAAEGFTTVINLATIPGRDSLPDEAGLVRSLGMAYHHIPVQWDNPTESDFAVFEAVFSQLYGVKTLLHCAANFRATAFYALYAMKNLGWPEEKADEFMASIWSGSNYPIWQRFIEDMKTKIRNANKPANTR